MTGTPDRDVSHRPDGKGSELATVRHRQFIRSLDFKMQQRKKIVEMEALIKDKKVTGLRKAALQNARNVLQPVPADQNDQDSCHQHAYVDATAEKAHHTPSPTAPAAPEQGQQSDGRLEQTTELTRLPTPEAEAVAERMRTLVDAALNGVEPSASTDGKGCQRSTVACTAEAEDPGVAAAQCDSDATRPVVTADRAAEGASPASEAPKTGKRPMWAVTEDQAEAMEAAEEDCLLDFAEQLDIDALAEDLSDAELAEAMRALNKDGCTTARDNPAEWRRTFVRAMNCIANRAAAGHGAAAATAPSVAAFSETPSAAASTTASAAAKAAAGAAKCRAMQAKQVEGQVDWDARTCIAEEGSNRAPEPGGGEARMGADPRGGMVAIAGDLLRENPDLKHMHSARSLKTLLEQSASCERIEGAAALAAPEPILLSV